MLSDEELGEIEKRAQAATAGPWVRVEYYEDTIEDHAWMYAEVLRGGLMDGPDKAWPVVDHVATGTATICYAGNGPTSRRNAAFIAGARTDVSDLLDTVHELHAELTEGAACIDGILKYLNELPFDWGEFVGADIERRVIDFQAKHSDRAYWKAIKEEREVSDA